jgi:hypothetical protein
MARYDESDFEGEGFVVGKTPEGRSYMLPKSARRLSGDALEVYADLLAIGVKVSQLEDEMTELATDLRRLGVSWALIGSAVGLTGSGAQKRYSGDE